MKRRIFVGLGLDEESRRGVAKVMKMLGRKHWPVRWEAEEKWHVTLAFLGDVEESEVLRQSGASHSTRLAQDDEFGMKILPNSSSELCLVARIVKQVTDNQSPFRLGFKGLGAFPNLLLPYSIWMSVVGDLKSLHALRKELVAELEKAGFELDGKQFVPHVTLGRVKRSAGRKVRLAMGKEIGKLREMKLDFEWQVTEVGVFESKLTPEGSKYEVVERLGLRV